MSGDLRCPSCGEEEDLTGSKGEHGIEIECGACGASWLRDPTPRCPHCGGTDLVPDPKPHLQKARGNQYSVVGYALSYLCTTCHASELEARQPRSTPLPPEDPWK